MKAFDLYLNYDDVWLHSAATMKENPEFTLHFQKSNEGIGDLTLRFSSKEDVIELITNLSQAFGISYFIEKGDKNEKD